MPSTSISGESDPNAEPCSENSVANKNCVLRLNDDYIVFRGGEDEAASAHLKGTLVLCLSEPLTIKHLRLQLTGMSRVW